MDVSFTIPYPKTKAQRTQWTNDYSLNAYYGGKHWSVRAKDAEYWHAYCGCFASGEDPEEDIR